CNIYYTKLEKFKWTEPKALNGNINMKGYWSGQPALSAGGDTLFFVSKRPRGKGNHDIWYATKSGDGENWGPAKNLDKINTPFSEVSPFFDSKTKTLYFSSNGLEGLGELDIFRTVDSTFTSVQNVGVPFNSTRDDFYYVMGEKYGYLASNRAEGKGSDDIYKFNIVSIEDIIAEIPKDSIANANSIAVNGKLMLADKITPASNIEVSIKDSVGNLIRKMTTDEEGRFRFESMEGKQYYKVVLDKKRKDILADVEYTVKDYKLKKSDKVAAKATFEHVFFNFDDYKLRPEGKIVLDKLFDIIQKHPNLQIELGAYTDNFGPADYNLQLSEMRSKEAFKYLKDKGIDKTALVQGFGEDSPLASNDNPIGRQLNRRLDFGIIGVDSIRSFGQVYISTIDQTLQDVAKEFKVPIATLRKMNGLSSDELQPFRPVRIPSDGTQIISEVTLNMANGTDYNKYNKQYDNANVSALEHKGQITKVGEETFYVVAKGNTVYSISKFFRMKPEELIELNALNGFEIKLGQRLKVVDNREQ
ncbi:MAG TPA: OmpA family protein, partial [Cytophagales bacterium]|nr:OmpA family protein [Cytophagales bacterium]